MAEKKTSPQRSAAEITKDIAAERESLTSAFDSLSGELQQAAEKAGRAGRKALVVVPAIAAAAGTLMGAAALVRRRRQRDS